MCWRGPAGIYHNQHKSHSLFRNHCRVHPRDGEMPARRMIPVSWQRDDRVFLLHEDVWGLEVWRYSPTSASRPCRFTCRDRSFVVHRTAGWESLKDKPCCPVNNRSPTNIRYVIVITAQSKVMVYSVQGFTSLVVDQKNCLLDLSVHLRGGSIRVGCIIMPPALQGSPSSLSDHATASWTGWPWQLKSFLFIITIIFTLFSIQETADLKLTWASLWI